ncbi:hypothetical protein BASA82_000737 [Batrachochytrium salamandrivorans]|uniref:Endonuclease III homolog n=1 Tax=Batrachochytrium salamandrivorans TaxID=1357716 RepID=A0ABQ8F9W5_9FUNG|nr:hypothetical protein BASA62_006414 [Batrachochytrium salamandrivorans]KAH6575729.1 hypothetical protein BASA60_004874 [Batrachochytrium salamandrivorans]KAH6594667.1 hypothetical protein BASA50_006345 [Batrachochytrium salamandrivorans]KAH6599949.1 hypothetical protein BASA61_002416 [Batrachochytrium salamandrivorans]KAH9257515.1 hypothetical protein BASA81_004277 [Batrachochytrium salamandrivorans]
MVSTRRVKRLRTSVDPQEEKADEALLQTDSASIKDEIIKKEEPAQFNGVNDTTLSSVIIKTEDIEPSVGIHPINFTDDTKSDMKINEFHQKASPHGWLEIYNGIKLYRDRHSAPVDTMGCAVLGDRSDPKIYRYQTLTALQLSSQTKDAVTAAAINNLKSHKPGGLTVTSIIAMDAEQLDAHIGKVGFHNRKTIYLKQTAQILADKYNGDIPDTLEGLISLPGVGPKMAHLAMQAAWNQTVGIGVDTHVHRISHRLGWTRDLKTPEHSRKELEGWLPKQYWGDVNHVLVGWGQTVCLPIGPKCASCPVAHLCPRIGVKSPKTVGHASSIVKSSYFLDPKPDPLE